MLELKKLFEEVNIPKEKLEDLAQSLKSEPMAAMGLIQQLNLPPDFFLKVMAIDTANPNAALDFASELGISKDTVDELGKNLKEENMSSSDKG